MQQPSLKILHLITKSNLGGAQKYVFDLTVASKDAGHEVIVACGTGGELIPKLQQNNIEVIPVHNFARDVSVWRDVRAVGELIGIIRRVRPDVIHISSSKAGLLGAIAGRLQLFSTRIIFTSHGLTMDEVWRPWWQRKIITLLTWLTFTLSHHTITISTDNYSRVITMPGLTRKVSLVKNGLGPIHLLDRTTARNKLIKLPPKTMWIGGIGELHPNKNWSTAILAMKQLPTEAHLLIIGEGEERTHLTELINQESLSDRVHLLGYLDGATYLNAFDIFILPSLKEGLPYALIEAGQAGLPVVASDLPGNHDIITTGETGFLIEPTPQLISTTLTMLLRDEGMRGQLGRTLQQVVQQEFSIARMLQETLQVYECNKSADWYSTGA